MSATTIKTCHGVSILTSSHTAVRALRRVAPQARLHGNKVWTATYVLIDFLQQRGLPTGSRVLDLGCGWGVLSCYLAREFGAEVTGIDADDAVQPYFALHAQHNAVTPRFLCQNFEALTAEFLAGFDVIVASDICFWDQSVQPLVQLLERALEAGVKQVLIADPGRPPFWQLADHCAETFFAEVQMHRIDTPRVATKPVMLIENA